MAKSSARRNGLKFEKNPLFLTHRRVVLSTILGGIFLFYIWLFYFSLTPQQPKESCPVVFYSNQCRQDLKLTFCQAIKKAQHSIFLSMYAITDPEVIALLDYKSHQGIDTTVFFDPSASPANLKKLLHAPTKLFSVHCRGLMHRKILIVDDALVYLGSANLTTQSLRLHDNFVIGLFSPPLAQYLRNPTIESYRFNLTGQTAELWLLPENGTAALNNLIERIDHASSSIKIAIFTLTHPQIIASLIAAKQRGVKVEIAVDYFTARGASKKSIEQLKPSGIAIYLSQGRQLLHHKWALIDDEALAMGSANWTKAAFARNQDFILMLYPLNANQKKYMQQLWEILSLECN